MEKIALLSGLIGALLSAALSYGIRASLDKRALRHAESRLAYVHLVQISQLVAMEAVLTNYFRLLVGGRAGDTLTSKDGTFQPSHKISVLLAQQLQKSKPEKWKDEPGFSVVPVFLKSQLDSISDSKLTAEQLSKLPKESVLIYAQFLSYLSHVRGVVLLYVSFFEDEKPPLITAENLHDQWLTMKRFFDHAGKLRLALVSGGAASAIEAATLLQRQVALYNEQLVSKLQDKPKIDAALAQASSEATDTKKG